MKRIICYRGQHLLCYRIGLYTGAAASNWKHMSFSYRSALASGHKVHHAWVTSAKTSMITLKPCTNVGL